MSSLSCAFLLLACSNASGLITRLTSLEDLIRESDYILIGSVDSLDKNRPSMVISNQESLKGKATWAKFSMLLEGDSQAIRQKEPVQLLKRLETGRPLLVFLNKREGEYSGFTFTQGTWFSFNGRTVDGDIRWSFSHLEPYLRRTFAGSTKQLVDITRESLSGRRKAPPPNSKEKPGLGPEVIEEKSGVAPYQSKKFAVIPTVLIGGPFAILALIFPTFFGGWQRWLTLISIGATYLSIISLQWWFAEELSDSWWGSPRALWTILGIVTLIGFASACMRHSKKVRFAEAPLLASAKEFYLLLISCGVGATVLGILWAWGQAFLSPIWLPATILIFALWIGLFYVGMTWIRGPRLTPSFATESVILFALSILISIVAPSSSPTRPFMISHREEGPQHPTIDGKLLWKFKLPDRGAIVSSPLVVGNLVYITAAHDSVFHPYGAVYCLKLDSGVPVWSFNDSKKMKPAFSSPCWANNRLYFGEGFHEDQACKLYCLDAEMGKKLWDFQTGSHTESTPAFSDGKVFIGAGDDGAYCLDSLTGQKQWNFPGFHIDAPPLVVQDTAYFGCGVGDAFKTSAIVALTASSGKLLWRVLCEFPVWNRPVEDDGRLFVASGNGRLNESADSPGGRVFCIDSKNGMEFWRVDFSEAVLGSLALGQHNLFFGCGDGHFYSLDKKTGQVEWKTFLGGRIVNTPGFFVCNCCKQESNRLYVATFDGSINCLDAEKGTIIWTQNLQDHTNSPVEVVGNPCLTLNGNQPRLLVAATKISSARTGELFCFQETKKE